MEGAEDPVLKELVGKAAAWSAMNPEAHWKQVEVLEQLRQLEGQDEQVVPLRNIPCLQAVQVNKV